MGNTEIWKAKGKSTDTNTGGSPPEPAQLPRNSPSEEVRRHWTPTGAEPTVQWMDGCYTQHT